MAAWSLFWQVTACAVVFTSFSLAVVDLSGRLPCCPAKPEEENIGSINSPTMSKKSAPRRSSSRAGDSSPKPQSVSSPTKNKSSSLATVTPVAAVDPVENEIAQPQEQPSNTTELQYSGSPSVTAEQVEAEEFDQEIVNVTLMQTIRACTYPFWITTVIILCYSVAHFPFLAFVIDYLTDDSVEDGYNISTMVMFCSQLCVICVLKSSCLCCAGSRSLRNAYLCHWHGSRTANWSICW